MSIDILLDTEIQDLEFELDNEIQDLEFDVGELAFITNRDHATLINRDVDNQHPISAITGLGDRLDGLETSKQDKLTAGNLVDITNNTISIDITSITNSEIDAMFE